MSLPGSEAGREDGTPGPLGPGVPTPPGLPCRNSNNCPTSSLSKSYSLRSAVVSYAGWAGQASRLKGRATGPISEEGLDSDGRFWRKTENGTWERMGRVNSAEAKRAFALRMNVEAFFEHYGRDVCGFLTLSPDRHSDAAEDPKDLARRFHEARKHALTWLRSYVRVLEPRRDGSAHHHLCVASPFNLEPDKFDWEAFRIAQEQAPKPSIGKPAGPQFQEMRRRYVETAPSQLRECWSELRSISQHYGLGRSELLPLRKCAGAVAHYVGAYLEGGLHLRRDEWKGARRIEYDRTESGEWKRAGSAFGWQSPGARAWRLRVGELAQAAAIPFDDLSGFKQKFGRSWAYHWRPSIMTAPEEEWRELLRNVAHGHGGEVPRKPRMLVGGEVVAWWD